MDEIKFIDLLVDVDNLNESLFQIYKQLRPDSEKSKTVFKELNGGFINLSYALYPENDFNNAIVFRTYGKKINDEEILKMQEELEKQGFKNDQKMNFKDKFFDRTNEAFIMHSLSKLNLCKPVFAKYINGMCFGYAPGVTSSGPLMLTNDYFNEMTTKLAKLHSVKIDLPENEFLTYFNKINQQAGPSFQPIIEMVIQEIEKIKEFPYNKYPKLFEIILEEKSLIAKLEEYGMGEIVFCHNDLNQKNIIWNPQERELSFIDFEMSMNNFVGYELGYYFFYFSGHFLNDFEEDLIPNEENRLNFIRKYLEERYKLKNEKPDEKVFENEVEQLFIISNVFLLLQMTRMIIMTPLFDIKPDFFKSIESTDKNNNIPYFCGRYGYKVYKTFEKIKVGILKKLDEFLVNKKTEN